MVFSIPGSQPTTPCECAGLGTWNAEYLDVKGGLGGLQPTAYKLPTTPCECAGLGTWNAEYHHVEGKCLNNWCYVDYNSDCSDRQAWSIGPLYISYSYEACEGLGWNRRNGPLSQKNLGGPGSGRTGSGMMAGQQTGSPALPYQWATPQLISPYTTYYGRR